MPQRSNSKPLRSTMLVIKIVIFLGDGWALAASSLDGLWMPSPCYSNNAYVDGERACMPQHHQRAIR